MTVCFTRILMKIIPQTMVKLQSILYARNSERMARVPDVGCETILLTLRGRDPLMKNTSYIIIYYLAIYSGGTKTSSTFSSPANITHKLQNILPHFSMYIEQNGANKFQFFKETGCVFNLLYIRNNLYYYKIINKVTFQYELYCFS